MSGDTRKGCASGRIGLPLIVVLCLSACGGGGSSGTGGAPPPVYTGSMSQGVLDTGSAVEYAQQAGAAVSLVDLNGRPFQQALPPMDYGNTKNGSTSGTLVTSGTIAADGSGTVTETFSNYESSSTPGVVQNGQFIVSQNKGPVSSGTLSFSNYSQKDRGYTFLYNGAIAYDYSGSPGKLVANMLVSSGSFQVQLSGLTVNIDPLIAYVSASGRLYLSNLGYVDVSTPTRVWYGSGNDVIGNFVDVFPAVGGGELVLTGSGGVALHVQPLSDYLAFLGLDTNADGKIDYGARVDRSTGELDAMQPTGTTVQAMIELPSAVTASSPVTADGRGSYTPGDFVSYAWTLLVAPPGSSLKISGSEPTAQFTPDVPGSYILQLTATANGKSSIDTLTVNALDPVLGFSPQSGSPATSFKVPSYIKGSVNAPVTLDGRVSPLARQVGNSSNVWALHVPPGSKAALTDPNAVVTGFTPDVAGVYFATLGPLTGSQFFSKFSPAAVAVINVDEPFRFAAPAIIFGDINYSSLATGVFTSGGKPGFALGYTPSIAFPNGFASITQPQTGGGFSAPTSIAFGAGTDSGVPSPLEFLTADLDGDGISDIVTNANCKVNFQESGSAYATTSLSIGSSCAYPYSVAVIQTGRIGGHPAVVAVDPDYSGTGDQAFAAFVAGTSGAMQLPLYTTVNLTGGSYHVVALAMQDVDGDGEDDLAALVQNGASSSYAVQIYHGKGDGTFSWVSTTTLTGTPGAFFPMAIGDFNGDGKTDVAAVDGQTLNLLYSDGKGNITSTDTRALSCGTESLFALDLNHDGHPDLAVGDTFCSSDPQYYAQMGLFLSASDGTLSAEQFYPLVTDSYQNNTLAALGAGALADFDGDGLQDMYFGTKLGLAIMPQLPAVTSATISLTSRTEGVELSAAPKPAVRHDSLEPLMSLRMHPPSPY